MEQRVNPLVEFPLFQVVGGSQRERTKCMQWLKEELEKHHLKTALCLLGDIVGRGELYQLARSQDVVILDAVHQVSVHKIWLNGNAASGDDGLIELNFETDSACLFILKLIKHLDALIKSRPVWGCILIGGRSSRMGQPKHLIEDENGKTWLEHTVDTLQPLVDGLVFSGDGVIPGNLAQIPRLPDVPGVVGPLTGILSAMRWQPMMSWLLVACDMPLLSADAANWLLEGRCAGSWGLVPRLKGNAHVEPLFAWYDMYALQLFEDQAFCGNLRLRQVGRHIKVNNPEIPEFLRSAWENINTPEQLHVLQKEQDNEKNENNILRER